MSEPALAMNPSCEPPVAKVASGQSVGRLPRTRPAMPPILELSWEELMEELRARRESSAPAEAPSIGSLPRIPAPSSSF